MSYNLCLISQAGGGKDFLADYLVKNYGYTRYAFADNVKIVAKTWFPHHYSKGENKPRRLLQAVGTKFREIDENVWVKAMFDRMDAEKAIREAYREQQEHIVVTDCRMPNEYKALKERGFIFIRIEVDESVRLERMKNRGDLFSVEDMSHHSELFYDTFECDFTIDNNGEPESAYEELDKIINNIVDKR